MPCRKERTILCHKARRFVDDCSQVWRRLDYPQSLRMRVHFFNLGQVWSWKAHRLDFSNRNDGSWARLGGFIPVSDCKLRHSSLRFIQRSPPFWIETIPLCSEIRLFCRSSC